MNETLIPCCLFLMLTWYMPGNGLSSRSVNGEVVVKQRRLHSVLSNVCLCRYYYVPLRAIATIFLGVLVCLGLSQVAGLKTTWAIFVTIIRPLSFETRLVSDGGSWSRFEPRTDLSVAQQAARSSKPDREGGRLQSCKTREHHKQNEAFKYMYSRYWNHEQAHQPCDT